MDKKQYAVEIVSSYVLGDTPTAEAIVERLQDEGLLHLGYGKADVDTIVGVFKEQFNVSIITAQDRRAAKRLADTHGVQSVVQVIKLLASATGGEFVPTVNNVHELERKWVSVMAYFRKAAGKQTETIIL